MPLLSNENLPNQTQTVQVAAPRHPRRWAVFSVCLLAGLLAAIALLDYAPYQSLQVNDPARARNLLGMLGAEGSYWTLNFLGLSVWQLPLFSLWMAFTAIRNTRFLALIRALAMALCIIIFSSLATLFGNILGMSNSTLYFPSGPGGMLGNAIYGNFLYATVGPTVSGIVILLFYAIGLIFIFTKDIFEKLGKVGTFFATWHERQTKARAERKEMKRIAAEDRAHAKARAKGGCDPAITDTPFSLDGKKKNGPPPPALPTRNPLQPTPPRSSTPATSPPPVDDPGKPPAPKIFRGTPAANAAKLGGLSIVKPEETSIAKNAAVPASETYYQFPPITLLKEYPKTAEMGIDEEYANNMADLVRIIGEFGITVTPGEIHVGPVITCYEVVPAPGVRVEKVANLDKNIALHMEAQSVRILAPIPGKAAIGIELPNKVPAPVGMRDLLESEDWVNSKFEIPIALGKDVSGRPLISDLTRMPHLLIAGATGSGKSVCVNSIITSLVYRKTPKDVRLIMVDPKVVELQIFNSLPHMFIPVVTIPDRALAALKWLLHEMEQRYQLFAKVGVRNILGFNNRKKNAYPAFPIPEVDAAETTAAENSQTKLEGVASLDEFEAPDHLPYIVVVMGELADLMMVAAAEVETSIARIAQLAHDAGIHFIIATQRPSVNVITDTIKTNLPSRIAFQVASQIDSRTILDSNDAETLIGRGDMLFISPGTSRIVRAQGAFVSDNEVKDFVEYLKRNGPPQYAQDVQDEIESEDGNSIEYASLSKCALLRAKLERYYQDTYPHIKILGRKRRQKMTKDDYGNEVDTDWLYEIDYFIRRNLLAVSQVEFDQIKKQPGASVSYKVYRSLVLMVDFLARSHDFSQSHFAAAPADWDNLDPTDFEQHCCECFRSIGWDARTTKRTGDQGVDIIATWQDQKLVVQCKRYAGSVGNKAVQEIIAGRTFEEADFAAVITIGDFTKSARQLAAKSNVQLLHPEQIASLYVRERNRHFVQHSGIIDASNLLSQFIENHYQNLNGIWGDPGHSLFEDEETIDQKDYADMTDDELYNVALGVVKSTRRASTSTLQRNLGIGYNRAARMMDMMEEKRIVGHENGSKPREILVDLDSV